MDSERLALILYFEINDWFMKYHIPGIFKVHNHIRMHHRLIIISTNRRRPTLWKEHHVGK